LAHWHARSALAERVGQGKVSVVTCTWWLLGLAVIVPHPQGDMHMVAASLLWNVLYIATALVHD